MTDANGADAVVVGAGPNGLAAAIELARAGLSVHVYEASDSIGGGLSSAALTEPGFVHDLCSAIHPLAVASPFLRDLPLREHGLEWVHPPVAYAHPLDGGDAAAAYPDLDATCESLGPDGAAWRRVFGPLICCWSALYDEILQPIVHVPRHPILLARFGLRALLPAQMLANSLFKAAPAKALLGGVAGHSLISFKDPGSAAVALMLGTAAHAVGWPFPRGGAQRLADAMARYLETLGGRIETGRRIERLDEVRARLVLFDVTAKQFLRMAGDRLPARYRRRLERFRMGPGVFKVDYALKGPVPWTADIARRAGTLHLGGTLEEMAASEDAVSKGRLPDKPYILAAQHSLFDDTRAPAGHHTFWAYCHVPNGSDVDMTARIESQIERFAPGFRDLILSRHVAGPAAMEARNPNLVGGDINGGSASLWQLLARPSFRPDPYRTPLEGVYLCSSSTPPGGGVHGMCGFNAARSALKAIGAAPGG